MGVVVGVGGRQRDCPHRRTPLVTPEPPRWLVDHAHVLPVSGAALDVASGSGRNALWLAARGLDTLALDRNATAVEGIRDAAGKLAVPLRAEVVDLETDAATLPVAAFD